VKKAILITLPLVIIVTLTGFFVNSGRTKALAIKFDVKDLPEHGLSIITPSSPSFDELLASYLKDRPLISAEDIRPSSVFLLNTGDKTVVAYKIRWECMKQDGSIINKDVSYAVTWRLMDEGAGDGDGAINPNSTWFCSLVLPTEPLVGGQPESSQDSDSSLGKVLGEYNKQLEQYTKMTVSLDGVFFADGTFVGANKTNFFDEVKAQIDAKYDVLSEIDAALAQNKSLEDLFTPLEQLANAPAPEPNPQSTPTDYYNFWKKMFAQEALGMRESADNDRARRQVLRNYVKQKAKPWVKLRKLDDVAR